ncbi:DUF5333 domain-containing protein [Thalassovita taeanensis]|uniref:DUF5333 domain-containing protein n=1 Tax=Thalassovita taeanensis TaxID=657014 RepID=A0A1H9FPE8_9RHOB|nr:DUF5333 domain-containing protein [Thalassovita taeanensis]SEQ39764.1 hypothetical protein SAMN04488092_106165 [Thalassovita taeanensis]
MRMTLAVTTSVLLAMGASGLVAGGANAKPPLREVSEIHDGLLAVGIADEIRKNCGSISARMFRAINYVEGLKGRARDLGYTEDEIKAYYKSDVEKARMRALGEAYLKANGVSRANPASFCVLGEAEIAKASLIGKLLRAK